MATLNTLRTKGGVIVSIVIGVSLVAFLLGDITSSGSRLMNGRKMRVGSIAGNHVGYTEYAQEAEYMTRIAQLMTGTESLSPEQTDQAHNMAWEQLVGRYSYTPGFDAMGMGAGEAEQIDMVGGAYISPVMSGMFTNRSTGAFDAEMLRNFIANIDADPTGNANMMWEYLKDQMVEQRIMSKYLALISKGMATNALEVEQAVKAADNTVSARYLSQNYSTVADSLVQVSESLIRKYYDKHRETFRQGEWRAVEYVVFDMEPSVEDYAQAATYVDEMAAEFAASADPMVYANANSQRQPDQRYVSPQDIDPAMREAIFVKKEMYGPVLNGQTYTIARLADTRMIPDSLSAKHIQLAPGQQALADSLVAVLRKGGDFAALAGEYSIDKQTPGGDLGTFAPDRMIPEISEACIKASKGEIFTVTSPYGIHVMVLTGKSAPVQKVQVAAITYEIQPGTATEQSIYNQASALLSAAAGSQEKFNAAADNAGLSKRTARIMNTDRTVNGLSGSREIVRWAFNNKQGAVSGIMEVNGDYVIATVTEEHHEGYASYDEVAAAIRGTLAREEKARMIAEKIKGASLDEVASSLGAEILSVEGLRQDAFYIDGAGVEQQLIGAICAAPQGKLSKPVEGVSSVFLFEVTGIESAATATPESEKVRLEAMSQAYLAERVSQALAKESKITDMRVKFF